MTMDKIGRYEMWAEPFHCDVKHQLLMGHLGNYLLNSADFHSSDRGFGMRYLNTLNKSWVLSRLCIEMDEMPVQYDHFFVETWVENAVKYFTKRNFRVEDKETGRTMGYGRSVWALIDLETRQPNDIFAIRDGAIMNYVETEKECAIAAPGRVKMGADAEYVRTIDTTYSDVDINGHINSVRYIEHILDLFSLDFHKENRLKRFDIAYVAESYYGDKLNFYRESYPVKEETPNEQEYAIRITKTPKNGGEDVEIVRCLVKFVKE